MARGTRLAFQFILFGHTSLVIAQFAGTFTATGSMNTARHFHTATLLPDGRVLIAGGSVVVGQSAIPINSAELYDAFTGTFTPTPWNGGVPAALLADGRVLVLGPGTRTELYDPYSGTFTPTGSMAVSHGPATLLNNGKVLMTGGSTQPTHWTTPNAELYDPATGTFTAAGSYADGGSALQLTTAPTLLADGRVLIAGCTYDGYGYCAYGPADVAQLYDPATDTFSLTGADGFRGGTATLLTNGKVLFAGGATEDVSYPDVKLYDPSTGNLTRTGDMTKRRDIHRATLLPDGRVLITGGRIDDDAHDAHSIQSAELYDPSTGTFSSIGNMTARRGYHTATLLKDGRVLITGGLNVNFTGGGQPPTNLSSAEIYTPPVLAPAPVLLSLSGDGRGQGAIQHGDTYQLVTPDNPAVAGEIIVIYCNGLSDGSLIPPQVAIGGRRAELLWFGNAPGFVGLNQINVRVPSGAAPGPAVAVRLNYLGRPSNEVTIGVRQ